MVLIWNQVQSRDKAHRQTIILKANLWKSILFYLLWQYFSKCCIGLLKSLRSRIFAFFFLLYGCAHILAWGFFTAASYLCMAQWHVRAHTWLCTVDAWWRSQVAPSKVWDIVYKVTDSSWPDDFSVRTCVPAHTQKVVPKPWEADVNTHTNTHKL